MSQKQGVKHGNTSLRVVDFSFWVDKVNLPLLISETITSRGGDFQYGKPNTEHMIHQDKIMAGQNDISSAAVAEKIIELHNVATIKN